MYWSDVSSNKIQRADFDGSNIEDLVTTLPMKVGIALDIGNDRMYWVISEGIQRSDLNGANMSDLVTHQPSSTYSIALDIQ